MKTYKLTKEWREHHTLEEALGHKLMWAVATAERSGRQLPYTRIAGLLAECFEEVTSSVKQAEPTRKQ
jgi:hypothetical protein